MHKILPNYDFINHNISKLGEGHYCKGVFGMVRKSLLSALAVLMATAAPALASDPAAITFTDPVVTDKGTYDVATMNAAYQQMLKAQAAQKAKTDATAQRVAAAESQQRLLAEYTAQRKIMESLKAAGGAQSADFLLAEKKAHTLMMEYQNFSKLAVVAPVVDPAVAAKKASDYAAKMAATQTRVATGQAALVAQQQISAAAKAAGVAQTATAVKAVVDLKKATYTAKTPAEILSALNKTSLLKTSVAVVPKAQPVSPNINKDAMAAYVQKQAVATVTAAAPVATPAEVAVAAKLIKNGGDVEQVAKALVYKNGFGMTAETIAKNNAAQLKVYQDVASNFLKTVNKINTVVSTVKKLGL
jgi:hypothetical protein